MAREPFETLPVWKAATRLAVDAHRLAANFSPDEKSGLGGTLKKHADQTTVLIAHADAAESPDDALSQLQKTNPNFRELLNAALLAQQLELINRPQLRRLRLHVARLRRMIDDEIQAWQHAQHEEQREANEHQQQREQRLTTPDHEFDPRDLPRIQRELDRQLNWEHDDAIGLTDPIPPAATPHIKLRVAQAHKARQAHAPNFLRRLLQRHRAA